MSSYLSVSVVFGCLYTKKELRTAGVNLSMAEEGDPRVSLSCNEGRNGEESFFLWAKGSYIVVACEGGGGYDPRMAVPLSRLKKGDEEAMRESLLSFIKDHNLPSRTPEWLLSWKWS
jgi:hypothetical protein